MISVNSSLLGNMTFIYIEFVVGDRVYIGTTLRTFLGDVGVEALHFFLFSCLVVRVCVFYITTLTYVIMHPVLI